MFRSRVGFRFWPLFAIAFAFACASAHGPAGTISQAIPASGAIQIRTHLKAGDDYLVNYDMVQEINQFPLGMQQTIRQHIVTDFDYRVVKVDSRGVADVKITYVKIVFEMKMPFATLAYDSTKPRQEGDLMSEMFGALVGKSFVFKMDSKGHVLKAEGVDKIRDSMLGALDKEKGPLADSIKSLASEQFNEQSLVDIGENISAIYPDKAVGAGDSWSKKGSIANIYPMNIDTKYTIKSRANGVIAIDLKSSIVSDPNAKPIDMAIAKIRYDIAGDQNGTMFIDEKTGLVIRSDVTQQLSGKVVTDSPLFEPNSSWPITLRTVVVSKTTKK
jgi:hypothetical protein